MGDQSRGGERPGERGGSELTDPIAQALAAEPFTALLGGAGTGKSTLVREWYAQHPGLALTSSTGIAAVNLGEGTTINALLKFFDTQSLLDLYTSGMLTARLRKLRKGGIQRILLDEVSMVPADQITALVRAIDEVNGEGYALDDGEPTDGPPFGLTVIGDFCQLSPVKAPYAFESPEWSRFAVTKLTKVWRQADPAFIEALHATRRGDGRAAVATLTPCFAQATDPYFEGPTLLAKNDAVDRYNRLKLDNMDTPEATFVASRWGDQRGEWKQIPDQLVLKEGCLVMVLANDWDREACEYRYVNGDLGEFLREEKGDALVRMQRTGREEAVTRITREVLEPLEVGERKAMKASGQEHLLREKQKVTGGITYMPLRVAYATSIHKSQSLSFDQVQINLREPFAGAPAMTYVALSRARSLDGLRIIGSAQTFVARCKTDPKVRQWI